MISLRCYHLQGAASPLLKERNALVKRKKKPEHKTIQEFFYFLAFDESVLDQLLFPQCDEMLMKSCFPRGASASSLLTTFLSLLVSRTNASNCTTFSYGAVTNNAKLSLVSFIYSSVHSTLGLSHTFSVG